MREYNGGLTREQFLFYEIRIMASLVSQGYTKAEAIEKIKEENLFQFPTERMTVSIANTWIFTFSPGMKSLPSTALPAKTSWIICTMRIRNASL